MIAVSLLPRPPLRHEASLERNTETGLSPTNQALPPNYDPLDAQLACSYWEPTRAADASGAGLREGPNVNIHALGPRMLVDVTADVRVGDHVTEVRSMSAIAPKVITRQTLRVVEILWRETHQEVGLELVSSGPIVEVGS